MVKVKTGQTIAEVVDVLTKALEKAKLAMNVAKTQVNPANDKLAKDALTELQAEVAAAIAVLAELKA
jgi:predicted phage tail protein